MAEFDGRTVLITGAAGNFGLAGAEFFAEHGANVALCDLAKEALDEAVGRVKAFCKPGRVCQGFTCDITKKEEVDNMVDAIVACNGTIHHLWNNAGYQGEMKPTLNYSVGDFANVLNINVLGSFIVLQAVAKAMAEKGTKGSIVNTASVAALRGTPTMPAYVASKAALVGLTMSTAKDLAPHGIRVNALSPALIGPGYMWTRQNELHAASGSPYFATDPEQVADAKVASVPMKRLGTIKEVVNSAVFLLGDTSSYTTGHNLVISGGMA
mmetsp:Transcript_4377/g.7695  ORF Transcript_4377/g.7695 Transcript_4377/m.7695 type:complete len:268 (-) Transcript_4377:186-989(-)